MKNTSFTFTAPKPKEGQRSKYEIESVSIAELDGNDETIALQNVKATGENVTTMADELIRLAIVKVDGVATKQPFSEFDKWNAATRQLVWSAFNSVNGVSKEDVDSFLDSASSEGV